MGAMQHQLGLAEESTYGTPVAVTRFYEFLSESLDYRKNVAGSGGMAPGRRMRRGSARRITRRDAGGSIQMEVAEDTFGVWFKHILGGANTTGAGPYTHTFTPGTLWGKSLTIQKGVEKLDGTVEPFTLHGCKIPAAEFSIDQDGVLQLEVDIDAEEMESTTGLATASYTDPALYHYAQGTIKKNTVALANVLTVPSLRIANNFVTDRYHLGNSGLKAQPKNVPYDEITGRLTVEFDDPADVYDLYTADTGFELELEFVSGTKSLTITIADTYFTGDTPKVGSTDIVQLSAGFEAADPDSGDAITIVYISDDATP